MEFPVVALQLIDKLASVLPSYCLPEACVAHSRHYMPYVEGAKQRTTLVFNTWADVGDGELVANWPCELNDAEMTLLGQLTAALGYLGRSESWVEGELITPGLDCSSQFNAVPDRNGLPPESGSGRWEQVALMAPIPPSEYRDWVAGQHEAALAALPLPDDKKKPTAKLLKDRERAKAPYPDDLVSCLMKDTAWWKGHGWSQPPGTRKVLYWRPSDPLKVGTVSPSKRPEIRRVAMMLLALTTASGNRSALPAVVRTLPQAELFHRAIVGRLGNGSRVDCPELTGKDSFDRPLRGPHDHAHTIPVDLDGDGHLDHVIVYAAAGLGNEAQHAIRTLRRTWTKGQENEIQVALVGHGEPEILRLLPESLGRNAGALLGPDEGTRTWISATPFVPPRFLKPNGRNSLEGQIRAELESRMRFDVEHIEVDRDLTIRLRHFVRGRKHGGGAPPQDVGFGLRITFSKPVHGPILLGYGAHYGLGLLVARE